MKKTYLADWDGTSITNHREINPKDLSIEITNAKGEVVVFENLKISDKKKTITKGINNVTTNKKK